MIVNLFCRQVHDDYRNRRQSFDRVNDIFYYKNNLWWSLKPTGLVMETRYKDQGYFTNDLESNLNIGSSTFFHVSTQPTPLPLNPVQNVNVLFGFEEPKGHQIMRVDWTKPDLLSKLGCSAWQDWQYELTINDEQIQSLNTSHYVLNSVEPHQEYEVRIRAFSNAGYGPPSDSVLTKSWKKFEKVPDIVGLASERFYSMDLLGEVKEQTRTEYNYSQIALSSTEVFFSNG